MSLLVSLEASAPERYDLAARIFYGVHMVANILGADEERAKQLACEKTAQVTGINWASELKLGPMRGTHHGH